MKRLISLFLISALSFCLLSSSALAETPDSAPAVQRSVQAVTVDGAPAAPEIYNVDGYNYFKLRDLAALLSGTAAQFDVAYDEDTQVVSVLLHTPYTPLGDELTRGEDLSATAVMRSVPLALYPEGADRTDCDLTAVNIGGYNYFKLRDLGALVGFGVHYNSVTDTAVIISAPADLSDVPQVPFENFIFLGDSMISNPHWVSDLWMRHGHQVLAGGGAILQNFYGVTEYTRVIGGMGAMRGTLSGRSFNGIVILMGANDITAYEPEVVLANYIKLLDELQGAFDVPIFVLKVFPVSRNYHYSLPEWRTERANAFNAIMEEYLLTRDNVWFVDATADFTDEEGFLIGNGGDGLHISSLYYDDFYDAIEQALYATGVVIPPETPAE